MLPELEGQGFARLLDPVLAAADDHLDKEIDLDELATTAIDH